MARTTFWNNENFSQLVNAIKTNRQQTQKLDSYASALANVANRQSEPKPTVQDNKKKIFDWGRRTYGAAMSTRVSDDIEKQRLMNWNNPSGSKTLEDRARVTQLLNQQKKPTSTTSEQQRMLNWKRDQQIKAATEQKAAANEWMNKKQLAEIEDKQRFEEQIAGGLNLDPGMKPGDKVYFDAETNTITNKPTELEMYVYQGTYIPMIRTNGGQLVPTIDYRNIPIDLSMLKDVTYTPDIDIFLRGIRTKYEVNDPPRIAPTVTASGKQAYLDIVTNEVVDYPTQVPLYFDGENEDTLFTQNEFGFGGEKNEPVMLTDLTFNKLKTNLDEYWKFFEDSKLADMLGMEADVYSVRGISGFTADSITEGVTPRIANNQFGGMNVNEQNTFYDPITGDPIYVEKYPEPTKLMTMLSSIPIGEKTLGETGLGLALGVVNMPLWGLMYGGNVTKQVLNTPINDPMNTPGLFGISPRTIMAGFGVGVTVLYNTVASIIRSPSVLREAITGEKGAAYNDYINSWGHLREVAAIAKQSALTDKMMREQKEDPTLEYYKSAQIEQTKAEAKLWLIENGTYEGIEKLSPQQIFELKKSLEHDAAEALDEKKLYEDKQEKTIERFPDLVEMSSKYLIGGNPQVAQAIQGFGYESFYSGADFRLGEAYIKLNQGGKEDLLARADISDEQKRFLLGLEGLPVEQLRVFENFVNNGFIDPGMLSTLPPEIYPRVDGSDIGRLTGGANLLFLYDAANKSIKEGKTLTTTELYDYLTDEWMPNYFAELDSGVGQGRYNQVFTQVSLDMANTMFEQWRVSLSYQSAAILYREGSSEKILAIGNSAKFKEESYRLGRLFIEFHKRAGTFNPYASWTIMQDPEKEEKFYDLVIAGMLQLGRPLTMEEITNVSYYIQDPALELLGEVVFDANNLLLPLVGGLIKSGTKLTGMGLMKVPVITKMYKTFTDAGIVRAVTKRSAQSVAAKNGQAAADAVGNILSGNVTRDTFINAGDNIGTWVKSVEGAKDALTSTAKMADNTPFMGKLFNPRVKQSLTNLAKIIDPTEWKRYFAKAWDDTVKHYTEAITDIILKNNPGKTMADEVVVNQINHLVEERLTSPAGIRRIQKNLSDTFKDATLFKLTTDLGPERVFKESFTGQFAAKHGDTVLGKIVGMGLWVQNKFMGAWVWATLARRPAWMIYNFIDNIFRYTTAVVFEGSAFMDDMRGVSQMLSAGGVDAQVGVKQVSVPGAIRTNFRDDLVAGFGKVAEVLFEPKNMSADPLSFLSHYRKFVVLNGQGKGLWGKSWSLFKAFPQSVQSLNNSIENGMRTMMWLRLYEKNIKQLNHEAIADVLSTLADTMEKSGLPAAERQVLQDHVMNAWVSSGGNANKLYNLMRAEFNDESISGFHIYIPENLRQAEWFNESTQRAFIFSVSNEFDKLKKELASQGIKELSPEHLDLFFDDMLRTLHGEAQVKLQALDKHWAAIRGTDITGGGSQYQAARYTKSMSKQTLPIPDEARTFATGFDDTKKLKPGQQTKIRKWLEKVGIEFEDTEEGLKAGLLKLKEKIAEVEDTKVVNVANLDTVNVETVAPLKTQKELNAKEVTVFSSKKELADKWNERNRVDAVIYETIEDHDVLKETPGFSGLSDKEINALDRVTRGIVASVNNVSAQVINFFEDVYPGAWTPSFSTRRTQQMLYQLENRIAFDNAEVLIPLRNGTLSPTRGITREEILQLSGIEVFVDPTSGNIKSFQLYNPVSGETELVDNLTIIKKFKAYIGVENGDDLRKDLVKELLEKGNKPITEDFRQNAAYHMKVPKAPTFEQVVADDVRLDLAIREGRNQDAAVLIAERFQFKMAYMKDGQLRNDYHHLLNKVKKEMGLKGDASIKTLDDIKPEDVYTVLKNFFESGSGLVLENLKENFRPLLVKTVKELTGSSTDIAEYTYRAMEMLTETIGVNLGGKTSAEVWQDAVHAIMAGGDTGALDVMRSSDFGMVFNTAIRGRIDDWIKRGIVEDGVKRNLTKKELHGLLVGLFGADRIKLSGLDDLLKGKAQVNREAIHALLDKTERFITTKQVGTNYAVEINVFNKNQKSLSSIIADNFSEEVGDGNIIYKLNVTSMSGDLDEYSKQRLLSWAAENQYSGIKFLDGTVENFIPKDSPGVMGGGIYGATSWVKTEMGKHQALLRTFQNANPATFWEESFHALEPYIPAPSYKVLEDWAAPIAEDMMKKNPGMGLSKQAWTSEVMAKGFQKVAVTTTSAPKAVQEVFDKLRNTLLAIFRKWKNYFDGIVIPKNVEEEFIRLLDKDYVAKQVKDVPKPKKPIVPPDVPDVPVQGTLFQQAFKKVDDVSDPIGKAQELIKILDDMVVDSVTNLYKNLPVQKPFYLTLTPSTYDYVFRTFGVEETKSYLQQMAEMLYDMSHGLPVATPKPGTFVLGFNTKEQVNLFTYTLERYEKKVMAQIRNEDEIWSIAPRFITGWGETLEEAFGDLAIGSEVYTNNLYRTWRQENGLPFVFDAPNAIDDVLEFNEAALYPEIMRGVVEQPLGSQRPNLLMVHSTTEDKLRGALDLGGMPPISGAVVDVDKKMGIPSYGGIIFIGNKNMVDPKMSPANRTFSADIFSPRSPKAQVELTLTDEATKRITPVLDGLLKAAYDLDDAKWRSRLQLWKDTGTPNDMSGWTTMLRGDVGKLTFIRESYPQAPIVRFKSDRSPNVLDTWEQLEEFNAKTNPNSIVDLWDEYRAWLSKYEYDIDEIIEQKTLVLDGKKVPYNTENVTKWMNSQPKKGGEFAGGGIPTAYSAQTAKALGAREFVSLEELRAWSKTNLQSRDFMEKYVREYQLPTLNALNDRLDQLISYTGMSYDESIMFGILSGYNNGGKKTKQSMIEWIQGELPEPKPSIPDDLVEQAMSAAKILDFTPTTYFEFKPDRIIDFSEWSGVVLPYNTSQDVVDALRAHGLEVKFYGAYSGNTKESVVESFFTKENVLFQRAKKTDPDIQSEAWKAFVQSPIFDYGNEKVSLKDMWLSIVGDEEKLYGAGSKGFSNYAARVAQQLEDAGNLEMAEVFKELSEMTANFGSFIDNKISRFDPLFPTMAGSPLPLWKTNDTMREWVSGKYMVGSQWYQQDKALKIWRDTMKNSLESTEWGKAEMTLGAMKKSMKAQPGSLLNKTEITPDMRAVLDDVSKHALNVKNDIDEVANYGGTWKGINIGTKDGAVNKTNFVMMDYSDTSQGLQMLKQVFPFISYPAKSIGYWIDLMTTHPELLAFYYKYQHFTDSLAVQNGAVTSNGEVLPSLKGYMPLMDGLWFNPLAPLFFRFAFPRIDTMPETDETLTPMQSMAKFLLDDAPVFGFNVSPIAAAILKKWHNPYYPKPGLPYEAIRSFVAIDWIPPVFERWIMEQMRKSIPYNPKGITAFEEDTMSPRVGWADYLIERQILMDGLQKLDGMTDPSAKMTYAKELKAILGNPNRESDDRWLTAREKVEMEQYYRTMAGHMTGLYTKPFTDGQIRLQEVRDEINVLKYMIENQTMANLFGVYKGSEELYEDYKHYKFDTPEGYFWSAIQMSRYVVDPETDEPLYGQARRDQMSESYNIDEQTSMYYTAIKEAKSRYEEALTGIPVGDWELRNKIKEDYQIELNAINDNKDYSLANKDTFLGYKPSTKIYKDMLSRFWYQVIATKPSIGENEEYETYERRVAQWEKEIPETAAIALPILEMSILGQVMESNIKIEERMSQIPVWIAKIKEQANIEGMNQWNKDNATLLDAHWKYHESQILQPYFDGLKGKNTYEAQLFKMNWTANYSNPPVSNVVAWIQKEYGDKWTAEEIAAEVLGAGYLKPEDKLNAGKNDIQKSEDKVWKLLAAAGPGSSQLKKDMMKEFYKLGGTDFEIDLFYHVGGDVDRFGDPEEYTEFLRKLELAAFKVGITEPTVEQLQLFSAVQKENEQFKVQVETQLGTNIWDWMSEYYIGDAAERKQWRADNPNEYYAISQYYTLKDKYAVDHSDWASYYHPDYESSTTGGSSSSSGGGGGYSSGGGYSNSGSGYSATYQEYKRSPYANAFLPQGKRGARTGMELIVYGLGKGGVTKQPWWPQELLDQLHEQMVAQIQSGQVTQAGLDYLNSVAQSNPEYSKIIRDNVKAIRKLGTANRVEVNMK